MAVQWALCWQVENNHDLIQNSYVNLIPTIQGGTHVNGLRSGITDAVREFCEFRNLLPRTLKITPEDVWDRVNYVLSVKLREAQFSGQTKERLSSREVSSYVSGVVKDACALWLNQSPTLGEQIANLVIEHAQLRLQSKRKVSRKKVLLGQHYQANLLIVVALT